MEQELVGFSVITLYAHVLQKGVIKILVDKVKIWLDISPGFVRIYNVAVGKVDPVNHVFHAKGCLLAVHKPCEHNDYGPYAYEGCEKQP